MSPEHQPSPRRRLTTLIVAAVTAVAAFALIGCGGSSGDTSGGGSTAPAKSTLDGLSADEVLAKAKTAAGAATSVHLTGEGTTEGQTLKLDLRLVRDRGGFGTFSLGGGTVDIVVDGDKVWLKGDDAFYKQALGDSYNAAVATLISGKFLVGTKSDPRLGSLSGIADMAEFIDSTLKPEGKISRVDGKDVNGVPTVGLKDDDPDNGGILYVADDGTDLPLLIDQASGSGDTGALTLGEWGATFTITPPPDDEVLDISKLPG